MSGLPNEPGFGGVLLPGEASDFWLGNRIGPAPLGGWVLL